MERLDDATMEDLFHEILASLPNIVPAGLPEVQVVNATEVSAGAGETVSLETGAGARVKVELVTKPSLGIRLGFGLDGDKFELRMDTSFGLGLGLATTAHTDNSTNNAATTPT